MNFENVPAVDHARAAQLAVAILDDDDTMANDALTAANEDPRPEAHTNLMLVAAKGTVDFLTATIGREAAGVLLRETLAQLRAAENEASES
ncbi:hypothetical protein FHS07_001996 [Microbacterium proteolyticum]|uniref:Uncharacterized protein n=1 Tax=Microbacterium proteolyticum TaxID=1572644 RepID=A0A7W5CIH7_9MICO|nr:hypothetical protein [Microbacterium proteolyticum]MBB3158300.1 hypothetical protein [Microbacterium proteolyticum]